jgi:hypothetical protein
MLFNTIKNQLLCTMLYTLKLYTTSHSCDSLMMAQIDAEEAEEWRSAYNFSVHNVVHNSWF